MKSKNETKFNDIDDECDVIESMKIIMMKREIKNKQ